MFRTIFRAIAAVFELIADTVAAGKADGDTVDGILRGHIATAVEKLNAAAFHQTFTALDLFSGVRETSAGRFF